MAFIDIDYLKNLGFRIPESSINLVDDQLNKIIENVEREYFNNTIGYTLTNNLYALVEPYPTEVEIFLNGNLVDGEAYYPGVLKEISYLIMANFYGTLSINVNNSGFTSPEADGENNVSSHFIVNNLSNYSYNLRTSTRHWLCDNANDFFADWIPEYFNQMEKLSLW